MKVLSNIPQRSCGKKIHTISKVLTKIRVFKFSESKIRSKQSQLIRCFPLVLLKMISTHPLDEMKDKNGQHLPYVCVHCGAPCAALYRRLSVSLSSIKAMTCINCNKLVDPYIEREWLLVVIDCILLREEAFRHVLYNVDELKDCPITRLSQLLLGWSILDAYLKWQVTTTTNELGDSDDSLLQQQEHFLQLSLFAISSAFELVFQWFIMQFFQTRQETDKGSRMKLFWGLLLPSSFSAVTIVVSMWEATNTVRTLGSLLIAFWRGTAVWVVTNDLHTPLLGFVTGMLGRLLLSIIINQRFPCLGFELEMLGENYPICIT